MESIQNQNQKPKMFSKEYSQERIEKKKEFLSKKNIEHIQYDSKTFCCVTQYYTMDKSFTIKTLNGEREYIKIGGACYILLKTVDSPDGYWYVFFRNVNENPNDLPTNIKPTSIEKNKQLNELNNNRKGLKNE